MANTTYATVAELKERVSIAADDVGADGLLQQVLNTAAWLVDQYTRGARAGHEAFSGSASETRVFDDDGSGFMEISDALVVTAVSRAGEEIDEADWKTYPYQDAGAANPPITAVMLRSAQMPLGEITGDWYGSPLRDTGAGQIEVVGQWGYCSAANRPAVIKEATLAQAAVMMRGLGKTETGRAHGDQVHESVATMLNGLVRRAYFV